MDNLSRIRRAIEATRLGYGLTTGDVQRLVRSAVLLEVPAVCVPPTFVGAAVAELRRHPSAALDIATVASFPTGDRATSALQREVVEAVRDGAVHVDLVVPGALIAGGDWAGITAHTRTVLGWMTDAAGGRPVALKAILETAAWDESRIYAAGSAAVDGGARWLKTSTGFHPAGGATIHAVALLRRIAPPGVGVKASGGIRTRSQAVAMLDAGADRIGTSSEERCLKDDEAAGGGRRG